MLETYIFEQTKDDSPIETVTAARRELDLPNHKKGIFEDFFGVLIDNFNNVQYHENIGKYQNFLTLSKNSINYFDGDKILLTIPITEIVSLEVLEK